MFSRRKTVVIEHRYQPVTGQFFFGLSDLTSKEYARSIHRCAERQAAIRARIAMLDPRVRTASTSGLSHGFRAETARNWKGAIGAHLTLDKSSPDKCAVAVLGRDLKKTGPTTSNPRATTSRSGARHQVAGALQ